MLLPQSVYKLQVFLESTYICKIMMKSYSTETFFLRISIQFGSSNIQLADFFNLDTSTASIVFDYDYNTATDLLTRLG